MSAVAGFGNNDKCQLGSGVRTYRQRSPLSSNLFGDAVKKVGVGYYDSQVLTSSGVLLGQGGNDTGQLGDGTRTDKHAPVTILEGVKDFAKAGTHTLALLADGKVASWGGNAFGQQGDGTDGEGKDGVAAALEPKILPIEGAVALYTSGTTCLARLSDGTLLVWGSANRGQLGNGEVRKSQNTPLAVPGVYGVIEASVSGIANFSGHVLALLADGRVLEWGNGVMTPTDVGLERIVKVVAAPGRSYAIDDRHRLFAWGDNKRGRLGLPGLPDTAVVTTPTLVELPGVVDVAGGMNTTLARTLDGHLFACGENTNGEAGDGTLEDKANGFVGLPFFGGGVIDFASGEHHALILCREALPPPPVTVTSSTGGLHAEATVGAAVTITSNWHIAYRPIRKPSAAWTTLPPSPPSTREWSIPALDPASEYEVRAQNHDWLNGESQTAIGQPL